ncbi:MAG: hypothetical protein K2H09_07705 [Treponemataceae bacterium]|nr:hypothetical protein [Treponemataceae bacterium]
MNNAADGAARHFSAAELESAPKACAAQGLSELAVHDDAFSADRGKILRLLQNAERDAPGLFVSLTVQPELIDAELCRAAARIPCSLDIPLRLRAAVGGHGKNSGAAPPLFDKKRYSGKAARLNAAELVFGVQLFYADTPGDSLKLFRDRLDFSAAQHPNHIDFPQTENQETAQTARASATFSGADVRTARNLAFACRTFYSAGRAVPWFLSVLKPLKMPPSAFFSDFSEWQRCSSCGFRSGFVPETAPHAEIEKMQLLFLAMKYEEKRLSELLPAVNDIVRLNGAFSRLVGENQESVLETSYHPDDLLSPEAADPASFHEDVCLEQCRVRIFAGSDGPDYEIL